MIGPKKEWFQIIYPIYFFKTMETAELDEIQKEQLARFKSHLNGCIMVMKHYEEEQHKLKMILCEETRRRILAEETLELVLSAVKPNKKRKL